MSTAPEAIAIIGVGARLPGALDARQFWRNLRDGVESITELSDEELLGFGVTPEELADPHYVRRVPLIPLLRDFDADFFGMTAREARVCDPQLKLFLEVSHAALEDAGLDPTAMGREVGVFGSAGQARYSDLYVHGRLQHHEPSIIVLNNSDYVGTFTAFKLDLQGPALTVMTACSSSMVAVNLACQSLLTGECDVAVAGGANVELPYGHGYRWGPGSVRSRDGRCRPFDAAATGTVFGNGAATVVLKRLSDAVADRDHIRAVIAGTAVNNDGSEKMSFGAPSVERQTAAVVQAMAIAGVDPAEVSYVEAHGTGTAVGDPVEIAALNRAYRTVAGRELPPGSIPIGSVKANIGHTTPTAGVAGLIKLAMALEHGEIPPSINVSEPNPRLELDTTPFFVNTELRAWPRTPDRVRWAGISALGVGGTNAHLVVSEGPAPVRTPHRELPRIVVWSGKSAAAAEDGRARLADFLAELPEDTFADAVATLQQGRTAHPVRAAVIASGPAEAADAVRAAPVGSPLTGEPDVVFLFPGQGSQHAGMAAGLYGTNPVFTAAMDRCLGLLDGTEARERWLADDDAMRPTRWAQPLLFAVEYALAQVLLELGVTPAAMLGHSVGELVAATVAGVLDVEDAMPLTALRGRLMQERPPGAMLAVRADPGTVEPLLPQGFTIAVVNSPHQTVIAGPPDTSEAVRRLTAVGLTVRPVPTSHAFHSPAMDAAVAPLGAAFARVPLRAPAIPVYSAAAGRLLTAEHATDPAFWARQLTEAVRFDRAIDAALGDGTHVLVEVGPGRVLTGLVGKHDAVTGHRAVAVPVLPRPRQRDRDDERSLLDALATLWVHGQRPEWAALRPDEPLRRVPVPGYPYQRVRHWVDPKAGPAAPQTLAPQPIEEPAAEPVAAPAAMPVAEPVIAAESGSPFTTATWVERPSTGRPAAPVTGAWALALVPEDRAESLPLVIALQRLGYQVMRVRPGTEFSVRDSEVRVRPGRREDLELVFGALSAGGRSPELLVHGWAFGGWDTVASSSADEQLDAAFHGLHALVSAAGRAPASGRLPGVLVVTTDAVDVSGGERVHPVKATLLAAARTIAAETPGLSCRVVDVANADVEELIAELRTPAGDEPVVALRSGRRWVPRELSFVPVFSESPLRRNGVYLITGGLGGLGLAVAGGLASTGLCPRIVLIGRTVDDPPAEAIDELLAMGAQVRVHACDVADSRAVARVLDITSAQFGAVNGILHLAGLPGNGMLAFRGYDDVRQVLRPKVAGTLVLEEALRGRPPLDFFVSFSSRAALAGMVGSGDYAAANGFLDAHAQSRRGTLGRTLSVGWPAWHTVGMASARLGPSADPADAIDYTTTVSARETWALDEHRLDGRPVLPGTGHLDLVVRAVRAVLDARPDTGIVLEDVVFTTPLVADKPRQVRVRFTADGERHKFQIGSREGDAEAWAEHAGGTVTVSTMDDPRRVPVDGITTDLSEVDIPVTGRSGNRMFTLGPRWRNIDGMWAANSTKLVSLTLPQPFLADLDAHPLHPTLLDSATAAIRDPERDGLHLPFMYRRLALYAPLPARLYSRIHRRDGTERTIVGDIELIAADGTVVAEIDGFTMRRVDRDSFAAARPAKPTASVTGPGAGLDPRQGVRLLLELLAARTPAHVLVRPFQNGAPVGLQNPGIGTAPVPSPAQVWAAAAPPASEQRPPRAEPVPPVQDDAPGDAIEQKLRALWSEVLGADGFAASADFFDLGGDSMSAVELMGRIRDVFRIELSIAALFDHPTIAELSTVLRRQGAS